MFGGKINLYTSNGSSVVNAFNNKNMYNKYNYTIPESTYTCQQIFNALNNKNFFQNGGYNQSTISIMNEYIPDWDKCDFFYFNMGNVPDFNDVINTFNKIDVTPTLSNNYIVFKNGNTDYGDVVSVVNYGQNTAFPSSSGSITNGVNAYSTKYVIPLVICRFETLTTRHLYIVIPFKCSDGYSYLAVYSTSNFNIIVNGTVMTQYQDFFNSYTSEFEPSTDPYDDGGSSDGGGGTGDFDDTSDTVSEPSLPSISGLNTGMFTAFVCTNSDMQSISNYLWGNLITDILDPSTQMKDKIDALKLLVANPYDAIMGCSIVPVSPTIAGSKEVKMYGLIETGISLNYAGSRWVRVDCGTLNINEYWGAYLDYSPYTKTTSLYLPYIGTVSIDIDLIMGKALQIIYHVDILSGICIAYILINGSVEFQYQGQCSTQIPITNSDYSGTIQSALGLVGNVSNIVAGAVGGASGGIAGSVMGATRSAVSQTPSIAGNVMGLKPDIKSGGSVGSSGGILGVQKPYLIIERPRQSLPKNQNSYTGYPCNRQMKVSDCVGYTEFEDIKLENIPLTDGEKEELKRILSEGVILV